MGGCRGHCSSIHLQKKPGGERIFWELVMLVDSSSWLVLWLQPCSGTSPQWVVLQDLARAGFLRRPTSTNQVPGELISPKWLLPGKLQMKGWELLSLMAFYPAKCFVALFMTSVTWQPGMKSLKASFYFCLLTPSHCCRFASSLAGWKLWLRLAFPWVVSLCCWHEH